MYICILSNMYIYIYGGDYLVHLPKTMHRGQKTNEVLLLCHSLQHLAEFYQVPSDKTISVCGICFLGIVGTDVGHRHV